MSSRGRRLFIVLAIVALVVIAVLVVLPRVLDLNQYRNAIATKIQQATGGQVNLDNVSWGIAGGLWLALDGLTVRGAHAIAGDIELPRVYADVSLLPLLMGQLVIEELVIDTPVLDIRIAPRTMSEPGASDATARALSTDISTRGNAPDSGPSPLPVTIRIEQAQLSGGQIRVSGIPVAPGKTHDYWFGDVAVDIANLAPGQQAAFQFALRDKSTPGMGHLSGRGTFSGISDALTIDHPRLELVVMLREFDAVTLAPYLADSAIAQYLRGHVSLDLRYTGDLGRRFDVEGQLDLSKLAYEDPSLWKDALPAVPTSLDYAIKFDPEQIEFAQADFKWGDIFLQGGARISEWRRRPEVKGLVLKGKLPLKELRRLLPRQLTDSYIKTEGASLGDNGEIVIERLVLPDFETSSSSLLGIKLIDTMEASVSLSGIVLNSASAWPEIKEIGGRLRLQNGELHATGMKGRIGPLTLPTLDLHVARLSNNPKISVSANGPIELQGTAETTMEKLLQQYGFSHLSGDAGIELQAHYDFKDPTAWTASGTLTLEGITAETKPAGIRAEELRGQVSFRRARSTSVEVKQLTGRVNQAPFEIDGRLETGVGEMAVLRGHIKSEHLDLAYVRQLMPVLDDSQIAGKLDANVRFDYSQAHPLQSKAAGSVRSRGLSLKWSAMHINECDADLTLSGQTIKLNAAKLKLNDQLLSLSGQLRDFHKPILRLLLESPDLNVDRLLENKQASTTIINTQAPTDPSTSSKAGTKQSVAVAVRKTGGVGLPTLARQTTANVTVQLDKGSFRNENFNDLRLTGEYKRGVIKHHELNAQIGGGRATTSGTIDLREPQRIVFDIKPKIIGVPLESVSKLVGLDEALLHGPVTMSGTLWGRTDPEIPLMAGLSGNLQSQIGPGWINSKSIGGKALFNLLSVFRVRGILIGPQRDGFSAKGIPYDSVQVKAGLQNGKFTISQFDVRTPAIIINGKGDIDLIHERLKLKAGVSVLEKADMVLGFVPLAGELARNMTEVHLLVAGPVAKPDIEVRPGSGLIEGIEEQFKKTGSRIKPLLKPRSSRKDTGVPED